MASKDAPAATIPMRAADSKLVLTVYEPRWHGFAKWATEFHWPAPGGAVLIERQHSGFVRRRGTGVITQQLPTLRLSWRTSKNIARSAVA